MFHSIARALGAPGGEPPDFYKDYVLGILFVPAAIIAAVLGTSGMFNVAFWCSLAIAAASLIVATRRRYLIAAVLAFAALRFAFGFVTYRRPIAVVLAIVCVTATYLLIRRDSPR
jgi:hypothetical protein